MFDAGFTIENSPVTVEVPKAVVPLVTRAMGEPFALTCPVKVADGAARTPVPVVIVKFALVARNGSPFANTMRPAVRAVEVCMSAVLNNAQVVAPVAEIVVTAFPAPQADAPPYAVMSPTEFARWSALVTPVSVILVEETAPAPVT